MSKLYSMELIVDGSVKELNELLEELKELSTYDKIDLLDQVEKAKDSINKIRNVSVARVFIDFNSNTLDVQDVIYYLSCSNPQMSLILRTESDDLFEEISYKKGTLLYRKTFDTLIKWRLHTHSINLCSEDISTYITGDLEYLADEVEDYNDFKNCVLKEFKDIEFNKLYTKDNLLEDIEQAYIELMC